jgi:hypothetical protein
MGFLHSKFFKYLKNLIIGVGAAVVLIGALYKILSWPGADFMLMVGLYTEAGLFLMLGILGPEKEYYWEKLYKGLDKYGGELDPSLIPSGGSGGTSNINIDTQKMEGQLGGMLEHLNNMSQNMSSLNALQNADFSGASQQINMLSKFYSSVNEAMANISDSVEDTRVYKEQLGALNKNLASTNDTMKSMSSIYTTLNESAENLKNSVEDTREYKQQLQALNKNLGSLNSVYGNILAAMNPGR